jgi:hypothetical protein
MAKAVCKSKTRAQWAAEIRAAHTKSVAAILKLGLTLTAAKKALPHGEFLKMIKSDLPFTATVAQRLMKIATDPKLVDAARAQLLPPAWGTLYELAKLPKGAFEQAASSGAIHPKMTRDDAKAFNLKTVDVTQPSRTAMFKVTYEDVKIVAPVYVKRTEPVTTIVSPRYVTKDDPSRPSLSIVDESKPQLQQAEAPDLVSRLEKLVAELEISVEDDAFFSSSFELRIRTAADRLLSLVSKRRIAAVN